MFFPFCVSIPLSLFSSWELIWLETTLTCFSTYCVRLFSHVFIFINLQQKLLVGYWPVPPWIRTVHIFLQATSNVLENEVEKGEERSWLQSAWKTLRTNKNVHRLHRTKNTSLVMWNLTKFNEKTICIDKNKGFLWDNHLFLRTNLCLGKRQHFLLRVGVRAKQETTI